MRPPGPGPQPRHRNKPRARNFLPQKLFRGSKGAQKLGLVDVLQQEGFRVDTWKNFLALELLRLCDFRVRHKPPLPGGLKMACSRGRAQQPEGLLPGPLLHPTGLAASSPEVFPDGMEVSGGLDSEDDTGDQEEGAPAQAEPEGVLEQRR